MEDPLVGTATITYNASVPVNIYAGSTLLCNGASSGTCTTGNWVTDGLDLYDGGPLNGNHPCYGDRERTNAQCHAYRQSEPHHQ